MTREDENRLYRDAGDVIEETWRTRANGIRPMPAGTVMSRRDELHQQRERRHAFWVAEYRRDSRWRRRAARVITSILFLAVVAGIALLIVYGFPTP